MTLDFLTSTIRRLGPVRTAAEAQRARLYGLIRDAIPAVIAALRPSDAPLLVVTAHPHEAQELAGSLSTWAGASVTLFPPLETMPYERGRLDREVLGQREEARRVLEETQAPIIVAPVRALLQPVELRRHRTAPLALKRGDVASPDFIIRQLVERGYADTGLVDEPGTFGRRGGVIDVFPVGAEAPVRVDLFGDEIDSLRTFDPATQRSRRELSEAAVPVMASVDEDTRLAALEQLLDVDVTDLTAEAHTRWREDLEQLESGAPLDELAFFSPYLFTTPGSLADLLPPSSRVVIADVPEVERTAAALFAQAAEIQQDRVAAGELPPDLRPALLEPEAVRERLQGTRLVELVPGSGDDGVDCGGLFAPAPLFGGRLRALTHTLSAGGDGSVVVATTQPDRMEEVFREAGIPYARTGPSEEALGPGVSLVASDVPAGWVLPARNLSVLTDHELFGRAVTRPVPRRARAPRESFLAEFKVGDYVVHLEHGVGRFEGVTRMQVEEGEREYAVVHYAGADKVYVPTDQLERLSRYIGVGNTPPTLNKLGGGEWQRARQRAKQAADEIAGELVDLYAKRQAHPGHAYASDSPWQAELESAFPYPETPGQVQAVRDVKEDMERPRPMDRLVCADVGYGKTEVAVRAAFKAVMDGRQVALLAPTTILAQQHWETFSERFAPFPIRVEVLSRFRSAAEQRDIVRRSAAGEVDILIGTHRLLQKDVRFKNLGLLIIDEEQRFGVRHKEHLKRLRETVDTLTLTATPIPRTLHTTLVGIREVSVIETPPEGRLPVKTYLQPFQDRLVREAVLRELDRDGQVYMVHNKVATIDAMAERLRRLVPEARVTIAHGQMDEGQLERAMLSFAHHQSDVLLASTIIENGLDIPNVNTIIINNAHLLGLTQLYQLRGRVGRGSNQAYAYLLYPRDARINHDAERRMEAVFEAQALGAGFGIAMKDLEIRGAGNLLGAQQSGHAAAVGFDLYTRMVAEAVERLRGVPVTEPPVVTIDLPLSAFLPADYVSDEAERLTLYRRLAAVTSTDELRDLAEEIRDRFGLPPAPVANLVTSIEIKLAAAQAGVATLSLGREFLTVRTDQSGIYDRVGLYRRYGTEARISTNVLRIPRRVLGGDLIDSVRGILDDMIQLRNRVRRAEPVGA